MPNKSQLADVVFDLVYYGGFSYESVMSMPVFERDYYHRKIVTAENNEKKFEASIHGHKIK